METRDYHEGLEILRGYHMANVERPCQAVFLEHKFTVPLGSHVLIGAMDRVDATDNGYEVIDYKLDRELRSQEAVDEDLQLGLYGLALEEGHGIRPEALTLYFLRHNVQRTTVRTTEQRVELGRWVVATGNDITNERRWLPCRGDHCSGCDFRPFCPAHTDRPLPPPTSQPSRVEAQLSLLLADGGSGRNLPESPLGSAATEQLSLPIL